MSVTPRKNIHRDQVFTPDGVELFRKARPQLLALEDRNLGVVVTVRENLAGRGVFFWGGWGRRACRKEIQLYGYMREPLDRDHVSFRSHKKKNAICTWKWRPNSGKSLPKKTVKHERKDMSTWIYKSSIGWGIGGQQTLLAGPGEFIGLCVYPEALAALYGRSARKGPEVLRCPSSTFKFSNVCCCPFKCFEF